MWPKPWSGHRADDVEACINTLPIQVTRNSRFAEGLSSSLQAGFAALPPDVEAPIILLADRPFVTASLIDDLEVALTAAVESGC
jgi:molybdenum cofactor cytidylyltransferase